MTAPTTALVTATYYESDGVTFATGNVVFTPPDRFVGTGNSIGGSIICALVNGAISTTLAVCTAGYEVCENIDGRMPVVYDLPVPDATPINLASHGPQ